MCMRVYIQCMCMGNVYNRYMCIYVYSYSYIIHICICMHGVYTNRI